MLQETINRILSIAVVHEFLAHQEGNDVDMHEVARQIVVEVTRSVLDPEKRIHIGLDCDRVSLPTQQATSCALVLNELLHNTVEHAFASTTEGNVAVRLAMQGERVVVEVVDDGEGLPPDFSLGRGRSLGLQIVQTLVREDLKGTFQLANAEQRGARAIVTFPLLSAPSHNP
jgi:two-component sensor histidine kinase